MTRAAVFIDRDGTINIEKNYLHRVEDWEWIPGSVKAIRAFNDAGFLVVVISNQAGVARGMYSEADIHALHRHVDRDLASQGARIDAYYYCPHHPEFGPGYCACRKPSPELLFRAQNDWDIDLGNSWMIGDKLSDIEAGMTAGTRVVLVSTGYGTEAYSRRTWDVPYVADILAASRLILPGTSAAVA